MKLLSASASSSDTFPISFKETEHLLDISYNVPSHDNMQMLF